MTSAEFLTEFDASYYPISIVTCLVVLATFKYASDPITKIFFPGFSNLPEDKKIYWRTCVCSTLHAFVVSSLCVYSLLFEPHLKEDPIWGDSRLVRSSCAILSGYLIADSILILTYYKQIGDIFYVLHHWASAFAYYYVISYGVYVYFANFRLMAEFSTPWVNNRWFLATSGKRSSKIYFCNGLVLTAMFFFCRIMTLPQCWFMVYSIYGTEPFEGTQGCKYVLLISCFVLDVLNLLWFYKLMKGVHKQLTQKDTNANVTIQKEE